jgi:hypothetical protein
MFVFSPHCPGTKWPQAVVTVVVYAAYFSGEVGIQRLGHPLGVVENQAGIMSGITSRENNHFVHGSS